MNNLSCNYTTSQFTDPNHGHVVTGDTLIVQNNKLRKLPCKGSKNRKSVSINFSNCQAEIKSSLTKFSSDWCNEKGVSLKSFTQWTTFVMEKVKKKTKELKNKCKYSKVKQALKDPRVIFYLNILQEQYVNMHLYVRNIMSKNS